MGLIYKPNALYMEPNRESVDITDGVNLSFVFKGYQMQKAVGQLYTNTNIGEWSPLGEPFAFSSDDNAPYYNNQTVTYSASSGAVYDNISQNSGSVLGWGVEVFGMPSSQPAGAGNNLVPAIKGFETGNKVYTYEGDDDSTPYEYTFINNYDSKLTLGSVNSGVDIEGTTLANTFSVTQGVYINLTSGDSIKKDINSTAYYVYKVNEGASDPVGYYLRFYDTQAHATIGGTEGVISGDILANNTYYVNPTTDTTNIFYIGVLGGNNIQLYTTKEAALQGVVESIVPLVDGDTYTIQIAENSQIVQWTPIMANEIVFDLDTLYSTQTIRLIYSSGEIYEYEYNKTLYTGQMLAVTNGTQILYYYVHVWPNTQLNPTLSLYTTRQAAFTENSSFLANIPAEILSDEQTKIYVAEVLEPSKEFNVVWRNTSDIPMITQWYVSLYNVSVDNQMKVVSRTLIEQSPVQHTGDIKYTFNHLLLSCLSNLSRDYNDDLGRYEVVFNLTDNNGYEYEGDLVFDVGYETAATKYSPIVRANNCDSSVVVDWHNALSLVGEPDGVSLHENFLYNANSAADIAAGGSLRFDTNIPAGTLPTFLFRPEDNDFDGVIVTADGETQKAELSYDNLTGKFYLTLTIKTMNNAVITDEVSTDVEGLDPNKVYLIGYAEGAVYIREYGNI